MTAVFDEISSLLTEMEKLNAEIKRLEKQEEETEKKIVSAFADYLNEVYRKWQPRIDERIIVAEFRKTPPFPFEAVIRKKQGEHYSFTQTLSHTNMYQAFFLNRDVHAYESPIFIFPMAEFANIKNRLNLRDFLPLHQ